MEPFLLVKWLHVVSATVLFGTGLGTAMHMWLTHRTGDSAAIAAAARNTVRADWYFTVPSGLVQPASGAALIWLGGHDPAARWLTAAYLLYAVAGVCWLIVAVLQIRARDLAAAAHARAEPLPPGYFRIMRLWFLLGWPAFVSLIAVFWLMVAKPP